MLLLYIRTKFQNNGKVRFRHYKIRDGGQQAASDGSSNENCDHRTSSTEGKTQCYRDLQEAQN